MKLSEHLKLLDGHEYTPRVIERPSATKGLTIYYAWFPDWEGPARPDYAAAHADKVDRQISKI